jgi:hypothetical protein
MEHPSRLASGGGWEVREAEMTTDWAEGQKTVHLARARGRELATTAVASVVVAAENGGNRGE